MFFVISEDNNQVLTCQNMELEPPLTLLNEDLGDLVKLESKKSGKSQKGEPSNKDKGDAFSFFGAFQYVKDIIAPQKPSANVESIMKNYE